MRNSQKRPSRKRVKSQKKYSASPIVKATVAIVTVVWSAPWNH